MNLTKRTKVERSVDILGHDGTFLPDGHTP